MMPESLETVVQRVLAGSHNEADLQAIATAIQTGQIVLASGNSAVAVGGSVANSSIVPGSHNVINSNNIFIQGENAAAIEALLNQRSALAQPATVPLNELVQQVRSRTSTKILNLFSKIQLLNKRQIEVDRLYVDVYMLETREFRATIPGLLKGQNIREHFDRLGLGQRGERLQGLAIAASENHPRLLVLGKPGSGKSTFLRYLAVSCARGEFLNRYIPVLLELRDVDEATFDLFQWLHEELESEQEAQTEQILKQGQMLILLDGLDEVPNSLRQTVQSGLRKFVKRYNKNRFILTCRTQIAEYIPEQFQAMEVADFNPEQVECFALNWFTAMAETQEQGSVLKDHFVEKLQESPQTAELAVTPVLLSLAC
jgi:predicted NACHT family NTPase